MVNGAHLLLYSQDPEADRAFFRDVLQFRFVELEGGWLIFALPPAEMGIHPGAPAQQDGGHPAPGCELYLMYDDLAGTVKSLAERGVACTEIDRAGWGVKTTVRLPSGGEIGLYQPSHQRAIAP